MNRQPQQSISKGTGRKSSSSSNLADSKSKKNDDFTPGPHDILCGRGKRIQANPGNIMFQKLITEQIERQQDPNSPSQRIYRVQLAKEIVNQIRNQTPPGRFLEFDAATGEWKDIGDQRACEKARQALRDKACLSSKKRPSESSSEDSDTESSIPDGKPPASKSESNPSSPTPYFENEPSHQKRRIERVVERVRSDDTLKLSRHQQENDYLLQRRCSSAPGYEQMIRLPSYMKLGNKNTQHYPLFPKDESCGNVEEWDLDMKALIDDSDLLSVSGTPSNSHNRRESMFSPIVHLDADDFEPINCYDKFTSNEKEPITRRRSTEEVSLRHFTHSQHEGLNVPILQHPSTRIQRLDFAHEQESSHQQDDKPLYQHHTPAQEAPSNLKDPKNYQA